MILFQHSHLSRGRAPPRRRHLRWAPACAVVAACLYGQASPAGAQETGHRDFQIVESVPEGARMASRVSPAPGMSGWT
ncbi:hypothetical protein RAA17_15585 [Komagataeibacter rhaeticus]|nr:hypothetical protein [Komagataeibacter rhaeticus]